MSRVHVKKEDVILFQKYTIKMKQESINLKQMIQEINQLIENIKQKKNEVIKNIDKLNKVISNLKSLINRLNIKIIEQEGILAEKLIELSTIPPIILGVPNILHIQLSKTIFDIKQFILELKKEKDLCSLKQDELNLKVKKLEGIKKYLLDKINNLEDLKPIIESLKQKLENNSQKAEDVLKKIICAIDLYVNTHLPLEGDFNLYKKSIVTKVDSKNIILGQNGSFLTKEMGNYGEMRTSIEMQEQGYIEMTNSPISLNDKLVHGIDHIFYKDNKYFVVDSKSGSGSHLESKTATGPQLSDTWINARLDCAVGKDVADIIREKMILEEDSFFRIVSKVDVGENTIYSLVDGNGTIIKEGSTIDELLG